MIQVEESDQTEDEEAVFDAAHYAARCSGGLIRPYLEVGTVLVLYSSVLCPNQTAVIYRTEK